MHSMSSPYVEISDPTALVKEPLASIFMIAFNHEPYIAEAINSLLMQKADFPFELVIGEDCSTDGTRATLLDYQLRHPEVIRIITSESNVGMLNNAYRTLHACRGKYIAMCEGDDYWTDSGKLQAQVEFLERNPDYGLVHSAVHELIQSSRKFVEFDTATASRMPQGNVFDALLPSNFITTAAVCFRADFVPEFFQKYGSRCRNWKMLDKPLWLEIARQSKIGFIPKAMAVRRILESSASKSTDVRRLIDFTMSAAEICFFFIDKYGCRESTKRQAASKYYSRLLVYAMLDDNNDLATLCYTHMKKLPGVKERLLCTPLVWSSRRLLNLPAAIWCISVYRRMRY